MFDTTGSLLSSGVVSPQNIPKSKFIVVFEFTHYLSVSVRKMYFVKISLSLRIQHCLGILQEFIISLSANPTKWPNKLKQFVGNLPTNCLSVFDHFVNSAFKVILSDGMS